jgi:hypothetical protein
MRATSAPAACIGVSIKRRKLGRANDDRLVVVPEIACRAKLGPDQQARQAARRLFRRKTVQQRSGAQREKSARRGMGVGHGIGRAQWAAACDIGNVPRPWTAAAPIGAR